MRNCRPGKVVRVLALDQVRLEPLECTADGAVTQHQPIVRTAGHLGRRDGDRDDARFLFDLIGGPGTIIKWL
jgi:hypothetical protein